MKSQQNCGVGIDHRHGAEGLAIGHAIASPHLRKPVADWPQASLRSFRMDLKRRRRLIAIIADQDDARLPDEARACLAVLSTQFETVKQQVPDNDRRILADASKTEACRRLIKISPNKVEIIIRTK